MGKVELTGLKELDRALDGFEPKLLKKIARSAVRKAAKPVLDTAKARVPVDSGDLKRSLKIRALKRSRRNKHVVGVRVVTGVDTFRGTEQYYGSFIEYGTSTIRARPFLRPAADENKDTVRQIFQDEIAKAVNETAKELARGSR